MFNKPINFFIILGKIFLILFSFLLVTLVILAVKLKSEKIEIPRENIGTISINKDEDYVDLKITNIAELNYIEVRVNESISKQEMKIVILDLSFKINALKNVEVLVYNDNCFLFGKIINKGEIIIIN